MGIGEFFKEMLGIGYKSQYRCECGHTFKNPHYYDFEYTSTEICPNCKSEDFEYETIKIDD